MLIEKGAEAMRAKRRELIAQPLDRIWPDLMRAAIESMREPTVEMIAAAFPCEANEAFTHDDKCLGAAVCLKLGGAADIGIFEGEAVKQAAFLARDYRIMIGTVLGTEST